jgi:hypothetical protein
MKCFVIPVITRSPGIVSRGLKKISGNITRMTFRRFLKKKQPYWEHYTS